MNFLGIFLHCKTLFMNFLKGIIEKYISINDGVEIELMSASIVVFLFTKV